METIRIADTEKHTTRLGFGCSGIVGGLERGRSLALLETAFDAGIRHFDVAPMYGFGTAENVVGEFLRRHPGAVTVTTKFGLLPQRRHPVMRVAYALGRRVLAAARQRRSTTRNAGASATAPLPKLPFTAAQADRSLEQSLKRLGLESVDMLLLHEAAAGDLRDDELLTFLQEKVRLGRIHAFGVGSEPALLPDLLDQRPQYCDVVQSNWSAGDEPLNQSRRFRITHRALQSNWRVIHSDLVRSRTKRDTWSEYVGADLGDPEVWPRLLLRAALAVNTETIVLFSTRSRSRLPANVAAANNRGLTQSATRLHQLLLEEQGNVADGFRP